MNRPNKSECTSSDGSLVRELEGRDFIFFDLERVEMEHSKLMGQGGICWPSLYQSD